MVKPLLWRVCGWIALGLLATGFLLLLGVTLTSGQVSDAAFAVVLAFASLPFAFLWTVGTLIHRSRINRSRIQAAAFQELVPRGPIPTVEPLRNDTAPGPRKFRSGPLGL